jgi:lysophospholipase L1-like esterase
MRNLWAFGDSNTESYNPIHEWAKSYIEWKGFKPKVYVDLMAEHYGCSVNNFGLCGTNNYYIFQKICDNINQIKENDIVIVQWTETNRFRMVNDYNEWVDFYFTNKHNVEKLKKIEDVSIQTIQETLVNRLNDKYKEEIDSWESIIKKALGETKHIFWSPFTESAGYGKWVKSMETISIETNRFIDDPHLSEDGQVKLSELLIKKLENIKKDIL